MCGFQKILRRKKYFALWDILFNFFHLVKDLLIKYEEALETNTLTEVDIENELAIINDDK